MSPLSAAPVLLTWLALQGVINEALHHLNHRPTTPKEGNHA